MLKNNSNSVSIYLHSLCMSKSYYSKHKKNIISVGIILIIFLTTLTFLHSSFKNVIKNVYPELYALNIIPKPESFTELYFENHESLPFTILPQQQYAISFTIHNLEHKNMNYIYEAYITTGSNKTILQQGSVFLKNDERKTLSIPFTINASISKSEIVVNISNLQQSIDFWVNK